MARVPQIAGKADVPAAHQYVVDQVLEVFGRVRGPFSILLHSPELAERLLPMVPFSRKMTIVEAKPRFVGILATVREKDAAYVWAAQVRVAREAGLRDAEPDEREVALYARQLVLKSKVDQPVFDALQKRYGTKWLVELTAIMSFYAALCAVVNAFEVPAPDDGDRF
jgi:4-carboxymuconolactone decarboxylase